jgi:uncharacterized repeat protein (TIGR03943 family)
MRFKWLSEYWMGIILLLVVASLSLWLAARGQLDLYIHPRYIIFTVIMCGSAVVAVVAGMMVKHHRPAATQATWWGGAALGGMCLLLCGVLLLLKPTGLTSSAASQRGVDAAVPTLINTGTTISDLSASDAAYEHFTIKEWSALLSQSSDAGLFKDKQARVAGFISPGSDNNPDIFYLSRFIITCCAVDARPISVPVYMPAWSKTYQADDWLELGGTFAANPANGQPAIVLKPTSVKRINEPADPYVR